MVYIFPYLIKLLALTLAALIVCYGLGMSLLRASGWRAEEPFFTIFLRLLTGLLTLTVSYALVRTGGVSILLPVLLLLACVVVALRRPLAEAVPAVIRLRSALLLALTLCLVVFAGQYALVYEPGAAYLQTPFQDYLYYSRLTLMLNQVGLETNSLEMVFPQFQTEQPYHYLELWVNALLVASSNLPSVWVLFVSAATVLITIVGIGFTAIFAHFGLRASWAVLLGGLMLTVTGSVWPVLEHYSFVQNGALLSHMPLATSPKLSPVYLVVVLAGLVLLRERWLAAVSALAMLPVVFIAAAPAAVAGAAGLAFYLGLSRRIPWKRVLVLLLPLAGVVAYTGLFYAMQPASYVFPTDGRSSALLILVPKAQEFRRLLNISIGVVINYAIYYAGYAGVIVLLWFIQHRHKNILPIQSPQTLRAVLTWWIATAAAGIAIRTIGHHFLDSVQFFSNVMIPLTAVVIAIGLAWLLQGSVARFAWIPVTGLVALAVVNLQSAATSNTYFSSRFLAQVEPVLKGLPNRGGYLFDDADYKNAYMTSSDSYTAGTYVSNFKNDYLLLSLSALVPDSLGRDQRFARDSAQAEKIKRRSTLFRLGELQRLAGHPISADSVPLYLVRRAGLAFICASKKARLPVSLRPLVRASYRDARSGEVLYVLRPTRSTPALQLP